MQPSDEVFYNTAYSFKNHFIKSAIRSPELYLRSFSFMSMVKLSYFSSSSTNISHWLSTHILKVWVYWKNFFGQKIKSHWIYIIFFKDSSLELNVSINEYIMLTLAASGNKIQISSINKQYWIIHRHISLFCFLLL